MSEALTQAGAWRRGWRGSLLAVLAGIVLALGHAPWHLPYLIFIGIPLLLWIMAGSGPRGGFVTGWLAGAGYFAVTLSWIVEPFLVDVARHGWMAPFALIFMAGGLAMFWAVGFAMARTGRLCGPAALILLAGTWTLAEMGRTYLFTGFPWALIGYIWDQTPPMQIVAFSGPHGLGLLTILVAGLPFAFQRRPVGLALGAMIAAFAWTVPGLRVPDEIANRDVQLRLVQPNADQKLKWDPDYAQVFFDRLIDLTQDHGGADAVIWPEAAVPYLIDDRPDLNAAIAGSAGESSVLMLGALMRRPAGDLMNGLVALDGSGAVAQRYEKHHLVPFGEYMPLPDLAERLGLGPLAANAGVLSPGAGPVLMNIAGLPPFQPLICYEAIFPHEILTGALRPQWLLQVTNDAWFGTFSGPFQHLTQARFRATEQGLPLVRVANTGISTVIDPHGRTGAFVGLGEAGVLDTLLPGPLPPTLYARTGDLGVLAMILLCFIVAGTAFRRTS